MRQDPVESGRNTKLFQVQNRFILANVKSGLMIVDQQKAQERILFERMKNKTEADLVRYRENLSRKHSSYQPWMP
jgi:DNA mismatch repair protein MutL